MKCTSLAVHTHTFVGIEKFAETGVFAYVKSIQFCGCLHSMYSMCVFDSICLHSTSLHSISIAVAAAAAALHSIYVDTVCFNFIIIVHHHRVYVQNSLK